VPPILETTIDEMNVKASSCPELPAEIKRNRKAIKGQPIHSYIITLDL
jgi:hypothetical protein